ncbi:8605_t:CDS:2 [Ambispora gerdemannii]|uniref:8605_t:CDS:1 n=1 Tax=Ambispora gerdemannii TaxID=144530 RepID=A0A9N8YL08_9GLOM|nr:8605_t:CDS:2 [Ambispora gerdemannii]
MQIWFLLFTTVVFLLSSATTYIQYKRHAFILICLGVTGQLFSFSIILAAIATAGNEYRDIDNFTILQKVLCGISGSILSSQQTSNFTVSLALSIDLYMTLVKGKEAGKRLKWVFRVLCLIVPYFLVLLNILVVTLLSRGESSSFAFDTIESVDVCQVRTHVANNQWTIFLVRILPVNLPIFPAFVLSFMAIIPFAIKLFETRHLKQPTRSSFTPTTGQQTLAQTPNIITPRLEYGFSSSITSNDTNPTMQKKYGNYGSNNNIQQQGYSLSSDSTAANEKIMTRTIAGRMYIWCFIVSCLDLPMSIMGFIGYFQDDDNSDFITRLKLLLELIVHCLIFLVFATGNYANEQYRSIWSLLWSLRKKKASVDKQIHRVSSTAFVGMMNVNGTNSNGGGTSSKSQKSVRLSSEQPHPIFPSALNLPPSLLPVPRTFSNSFNNHSNHNISSILATIHSENNLSKDSNENDVEDDINDEMDDDKISSLPSPQFPPSAYSGISNITSTSRISTSHDRHSWLTKPPIRSISPDNLHAYDF